MHTTGVVLVLNKVSFVTDPFRMKRAGHLDRHRQIQTDTDRHTHTNTETQIDTYRHKQTDTDTYRHRQTLTGQTRADAQPKG